MKNITPCSIIYGKTIEGFIFMKQTSFENTNEYNVKLSTFKTVYILGCSVPFIGPLVSFYYLLGVSYNSKTINDSKNNATLVGICLSFLAQLLFWGGLLLSGKVSLAFLFLPILSVVLGIYLGIKTCKKYKNEIDRYNNEKQIIFNKLKLLIPSILEECNNDYSKVGVKIGELLKEGKIDADEYEVLSNVMHQMMLASLRK